MAHLCDAGGQEPRGQERARPPRARGQSPDPGVVRPVPARRSAGRRGRGGQDPGAARATGGSHHGTLGRRFFGPTVSVFPAIGGDGPSATRWTRMPGRANDLPRSFRRGRLCPPPPSANPTGTRSAAATPSVSAGRSWRAASAGAADRLRASRGVADARRRRTLARSRARRPQIGRHPADRRPFARIFVQHPHACLRGSGHGRARARPVCRHRRARARGALARCRLRAPGRRWCAGPRPDARQSRRWGSAARRASSGATPPRWARSIRSRRSPWSFSIHPIGRPGRARARPARAGKWLTPDALIVVEEAADASFAAPAGFTEIERRRYDDTELIFLRAD